jgi:hypothetical protein
LLNVVHYKAVGEAQMAGFDHDRFRQIRVHEVYPYGLWVWDASNGRGGMVCFRGDCRRGSDGEQDLRVIDWWMSEHFRATGGIDGLVVDTWELGGEWHDRLTFLPPVALPPTFRVLYSVLPQRWDRAVELWGADALRDDLDVALAEMDRYISELRG